MTLEQLLLLRNVVVDDTGVSGRIKYLSPFVVSEEMHTLVDVLVKAVDFAKRL